jgi:hypothetical protein
MTIIRNSAKCDACGDEIESKHRHDFVAHYCELEPAPKRVWAGDTPVEVPGEVTWRFAVDGGKDYLRRCGGGFTDTSEFTND